LHSHIDLPLEQNSHQLSSNPKPLKDGGNQNEIYKACNSWTKEIAGRRKGGLIGIKYNINKIKQAPLWKEKEIVGGSSQDRHAANALPIY